MKIVIQTTLRRAKHDVRMGIFQVTQNEKHKAQNVVLDFSAGGVHCMFVRHVKEA
jgi:hypothetical protein